MSKRLGKKTHRFSKFIFIVLMLLAATFIGLLYYLDILPMKYFLLVLCGGIFVIGLFGIILLNARTKRGVRGFFCLLAIIMIIALCVGGYEIINVTDVLNNVTQSVNYKTENYSVLVLEDSNYEELEDLKNKNLGYLNNNTQGTKKALAKIDKKLKVNKEKYEDVSDLANDLLKEKIDALVVEDSYKAIMEEEIANFKSSVKTIYTFSVKVLEKKNSKKVDVTKESFNVYISGIDTYGKITSVSRSDVNIIATINPKTHKILLTSIPRDYYVTLHKYQQKDKLTHAGIYGVDESKSTIEDLLDININYYVKVNFTSVEDIVDTLGGITVHSDYNFISEDSYRYVKGNNQMNGKRALSFARERHAFNEGDIQRGKNQMYVIQGMLDELMSYSSITKFNSLLKDVDSKFETNISSKEISSLIKMQISKNIKWELESNYLDGTGASMSTYTVKRAKQYVMIPDNTSIATAKTKISKVQNEE